jgi:hypothetical protein
MYFVSAWVILISQWDGGKGFNRSGQTTGFYERGVWRISRCTERHLVQKKKWTPF